MFSGKKFRLNEGVMAKSGAYFEANGKSFYKSGIEILEGRWNKADFIGKPRVFFVMPETFLIFRFLRIRGPKLQTFKSVQWDRFAFKFGVYLLQIGPILVAG